VRCAAALLSPSTGIVDSHGLMLAYQADLEAHGGVLALNSPVTGAVCTRADHARRLAVLPPMTVRAAIVVNCAGLGAQTVSGALYGVPESSIPRRFLAMGCYFSLTGRSPFRHLCIPCELSRLGTHVTLI